MNQKDLEAIDAEEEPARWRLQLSLLRRNSLARRLLAGILLVSTLGALLATLTELALDYRHEVTRVHGRLDTLQQTTSGMLAYNLWIVSPSTLQQQMADILRLPGIQYIEVVENDGTHYQVGHQVHPLRDRVEKTFKLEYRHPVSGQLLLLGTARIEASTTEIKSRVFNRFLIILGTQGLKTFLVAFFILLFFQWLVTRHLRRITERARNINYLNLREPLKLHRDNSNDELNELVDAFNQMRRNLLRDIELWEKNEAALTAENQLNLQSLNSLPEAALRTDARGNVTWLNPLAMHLLGQESDSSSTLTLAKLLPSVRGFLNQSAEKLFLDMQREHGVLRRRLVTHHADGRVLDVEAVAVMMRDQDRQLQGMMLMLRDASEFVAADI